MNVQSKIDFTVTQTRADYYDLWIIREVALAIIAASFIVGCSWAIKDIASFTRFTHLTPLPSWAYKTILTAATILGIRTLFFRPLVGLFIKYYAMPKIIYPIHGRNDGYRELAMPDPDEIIDGKVELAWKAYDGKMIYGCQLLGDKNKQRSGHYIIFCLMNGGLYDYSSINECRDLRAKGYSIILYHPPAYGTSDGPRTPKSDFYALEAIIQWMNSLKDKPKNIQIIGTSIGTGVAGVISAKYPLDKVRLRAPFSSIEGFMGNMATNFLRRIGSIAAWLLSSILRDMVYYDNCRALSKAQTKKIIIDEGELDDYAVALDKNRPTLQIYRYIKGFRNTHYAGRPSLDGNSPSEGEKMFNAVKRMFPNASVECRCEIYVDEPSPISHRSYNHEDSENQIVIIKAKQIFKGLTVKFSKTLVKLSKIKAKDSDTKTMKSIFKIQIKMLNLGDAEKIFSALGEILPKEGVRRPKIDLRIVQIIKSQRLIKFVKHIGKDHGVVNFVKPLFADHYT